MYYGYCRPKIDGWHTPKVNLKDELELFSYCKLHHVLFEEIIITDEMDFCVAHVQNHKIKIPQEDGTFKYYSMETNTQVEGNF